MLFVLFLAVLIGFSMPALARPVSYPGGVTAITANDADAHVLNLHYSPAADYSLGYRLEYRRDDDYTLQALQMNNLLRRWNGPDSQANLYLLSGIGVAYTDAGAFDHETQPTAFTGLQADWENRRYFISYDNRYLEAGPLDDFFRQSARIGIAPYVGDYGDLHTWLMVQADHQPEDEDPVTLTPLLRVFKGTHLIEAGISNQGDVMFNWIKRF